MNNPEKNLSVRPRRSGSCDIRKQSKMKEGETVYRVNWKIGVPYIEPGKIVVVGRKRNTKKIKWPSCKKSKPLKTGYSSIGEAIKNDIFDTARLFGEYDSLGRINRKADVDKLVYVICKTQRLFRKLEKHHLV